MGPIKATILSLPTDVQRLFLQRLSDVEDVSKVSLVCKKWAALCEELWKNFFNPPFSQFNPILKLSAKMQLVTHYIGYCRTLLPLLGWQSTEAGASIFKIKKEIDETYRVNIFHKANISVTIYGSLKDLRKINNTEQMLTEQTKLCHLIEAANDLPPYVNVLKEPECLPYSPLLCLAASNQYCTFRLFEVITHLQPKVKTKEISAAFANQSEPVILFLLEKMVEVEDSFFSACDNDYTKANLALFLKIGAKVKMVRGVWLRSNLLTRDCSEKIMDLMLDKFEEVSYERIDEIFAQLNQRYREGKYSLALTQKFINKFPPGRFTL